MYNAQLKNIRKFRRRQLYPALGFAGALATISYADYTSNNSFGMFLVAFGLFMCTVMSMFRYACPNCGKLPFAVAGETDLAGASVTAGLDLFPKKCVCCGSYLSKSQLQRDAA